MKETSLHAPDFIRHLLFGVKAVALVTRSLCRSVTPSSSSESYTSSQDESPVVKEHKTDEKAVTTKPTPTENKQTTSEPIKENAQTQPTTNPMATFSGRKDGKNSEGKGSAEGTGQKGVEDGVVGASGGNGQGSGISGFGNRKLSARLPQPASAPKEGKIVLDVCIDRDGKVVSAELGRGSSITQKAVVERTIEAAKKAKFTADKNAAELQCGHIVYVFANR